MPHSVHNTMGNTMESHSVSIAALPAPEEKLAERPLEFVQRRIFAARTPVRNASPHAPLRPVKKVPADTQKRLFCYHCVGREVDQFKRFLPFGGGSRHPSRIRDAPG